MSETSQVVAPWAQTLPCEDSSWHLCGNPVPLVHFCFSSSTETIPVLPLTRNSLKLLLYFYAQSFQWNFSLTKLGTPAFQRMNISRMNNHILSILFILWAININILHVLCYGPKICWRAHVNCIIIIIILLLLLSVVQYYLTISMPGPPSAQIIPYPATLQLRLLLNTTGRGKKQSRCR